MKISGYWWFIQYSVRVHTCTYFAQERVGQGQDNLAMFTAYEYIWKSCNRILKCIMRRGSRDWSLPLEEKMLKRQEGLYDVSHNNLVHQQVCTRTARSIFSGSLWEACGCINEQWLAMLNEPLYSFSSDCLEAVENLSSVILVKINLLTLLNTLIGCKLASFLK